MEDNLSEINQAPSSNAKELEFMAEGISKLNEIMDKLNEKEATTKEVSDVVNKGKQLEKDLSNEKSKISEEITNTVKKELIAATASEDEIIALENSNIRETKSKREKAKSKGIKERIEYETSEYSNSNKEIKYNIRKSLKENNLPLYCDSDWFYIMYCPLGTIEFAIKIAVFIIGLFAVPGILLAVINPWWLWKIIWWAVIDAIFVLLYITIYLFTKDKDSGTLEDVRELRERYEDNEKKIREISRNIKNDTDESQYNLGQFDEEIKRAEVNLEEAVLKKQDKQKVFEEETKQQIIDNINEKYREILEEKQSNINKLLESYNELSAKQKSIEEDISQNYEVYISKKYMTKANITKMISLIENNQAINIGAALRILDNK